MVEIWQLVNILDYCLSWLHSHDTTAVYILNINQTIKGGNHSLLLTE